MKLNMNEKNVFEALWQLLTISKVKVTETSLKSAILQHNHPTSILGISEILNELHIPNLATRLDPGQLYEIPLPAIAYFDDNGGSFVTITKVENDTIEWRHDIEGIRKESITNFTHKWQGITLLIEPNEESGELNFKQNRSNEILNRLRLPFFVVGLLVILGVMGFETFQKISFHNNQLYYILLLSKTIGLTFSAMLVWYSFDATNSFLQSVCIFNNKSNCDSILNAPAAKLFGWISWAEIGFFYFSGGFLALLFDGVRAIPFIQILGVMVMPFTLWSVYYQGFVVRKWCVLCLGIQVLFWIEFLFNWPINTGLPATFSYKIVLIAFLVTPVLWVLIKGLLIKSLRADGLYFELQKLKFNTDFVNTIFSKEAFLPPFFDGMQTIQLGNNDAGNHLLLILSPGCGSCRQSYFAAKRLVENDGNIKIDIVLAASMAVHDEGGRVASQILGQANGIDTKTALDEWFNDNNKDIEKWEAKFGIRNDNKNGREQMALHLRWLEMANIREAPVRFLNNRFIPKTYQADDLGKIVRNQFNLGFANQT